MSFENCEKNYENKVREWCSRINIEYNSKIIPYYAEGIALYNEKKLFAVDKQRLTDYNQRYNIFRKWFSEVLMACDDISKNEDLLIYIYTFISVLLHKADAGILKEPNLNCRATDFASLFSFLYFLDDMISGMKKRGCSHQIISDTLNGFDSEMTDYYNINGRCGMRGYVGWFMLFLNNKIFRIGRLQFEIHCFQEKLRVYEKDGDIKILVDGEYMHPKGMIFGSAMQDDESEKYFADITEDGDKIIGYAVNEFGECIPHRITLEGYKEVLKQGDYVISTHVTSDGPLDYELCERAYKEAKCFFETAYPEYDFKAFICLSWLMDKRLKQVIGKVTNITRFSDEYYSCPLVSQGAGVYFSVFHFPTPVSADKLQEDTSLQKKLKEYLGNGNIIYEKCGIRLIKNAIK